MISPVIRDGHLQHMENVIVTHGHFVQGVMDNDKSYAYTVGRSDNAKPEFYMDRFAEAYGTLLTSIPKRYDLGEIELKVPFTMPGWMSKYSNELTKFVIDEATDAQKERMLATYSRARRQGRYIGVPLQIIIADKDNNLPDKYRLNAKIDEPYHVDTVSELLVMESMRGALFGDYTNSNPIAVRVMRDMIRKTNAYDLLCLDPQLRASVDSDTFFVTLDDPFDDDAPAAYTARELDSSLKRARLDLVDTEHGVDDDL